MLGAGYIVCHCVFVTTVWEGYPGFQVVPAKEQMFTPWPMGLPAVIQSENDELLN